MSRRDSVSGFTQLERRNSTQELIAEKARNEELLVERAKARAKERRLRSRERYKVTAPSSVEIDANVFATTSSTPPLLNTPIIDKDEIDEMKEALISLWQSLNEVDLTAKERNLLARCAIRPLTRQGSTQGLTWQYLCLPKCCSMGCQRIKRCARCFITPKRPKVELVSR